MARSPEDRYPHLEGMRTDLLRSMARLSPEAAGQVATASAAPQTPASGQPLIWSHALDPTISADGPVSTGSTARVPDAAPTVQAPPEEDHPTAPSVADGRRRGHGHGRRRRHGSLADTRAGGSDGGTSHHDYARQDGYARRRGAGLAEIDRQPRRHASRHDSSFEPVRQGRTRGGRARAGAACEQGREGSKGTGNPIVRPPTGTKEGAAKPEVPRPEASPPGQTPATPPPVTPPGNTGPEPKKEAEPRPTPPVAQPPPVTAPAGPSDEELVQATITRWARAYAARDARAVDEVQPGTERAFEEQFGQLRSLESSLSGCRVVVQQTRATAECAETFSAVLKVGNRRSDETRRRRFPLDKASGAWRITSSQVVR